MAFRVCVRTGRETAGPSTPLRFGRDDNSVGPLAAIRLTAFWGHFLAIELSSRLSRPAVEPERTRISCHAALDMAASAAFRKESRMNFANATKFDRKSGVA
jgi:hypothetical protein